MTHGQKKNTDVIKHSKKLKQAEEKRIAALKADHEVTQSINR